MSSLNPPHPSINLGRYELIKCDPLEPLPLYIKLYIAENAATPRSSIQSLLPSVHCILRLFGHHLIAGRLRGNDIYHSQQIICMADLYGPYIPDPNDGYIDVSCSYLGLPLPSVYEADLMM